MIAYLIVAADVHQHGAGGLGRTCFLRAEANESGACVGQEVIDGPTAEAALVHGCATAAAVGAVRV